MNKPINPSQDLSPTDSSSAPIGIDFGTTNSAMSRYLASFIKKGPENLNFPLTGNILYPSIALLDNENDTIRTGITAFNRRFIEPEKIIASVKRKISEEERYEMNGRWYSNVDITEAIISDFVREIKLTDHNMHPQVVVVAVPYYFGENENASIKKAAEKAIFKQLEYEPEVFLLPEPVAASIACIYEFPDNTVLNSNTFFIYDIGGGTLDLTLVRVTKGAKSFDYEILANDGIATFGGDDIDDLLYDYVLIHEGINLSNLDAHYRIINRARIIDECRQAKHYLSTVENYSFMCANLIGLEEDHIELDISRDTLDLLLRGQNGSKRNMYSELAECVERLYSKANLNKEDVDYILPVGGTSLVPLFHNLMSNLHASAKEITSPDKNNNYVMVANGACIFAAMKSDEKYHTQYHPFNSQNSIERMKTRISHSLFLKKYNGKLDVIIEANSLSPTQIEKTYYPSKFQDNGLIVDLDSVQLFQGQGVSRKNGHYIGSIDFTQQAIYAHGRKLDEIPIHVSFEASDTLVKVTCLIPKSDINGKDISFTQIICQQ